jgi:glycosyltransferase involved in cell wall biosynthesis
MDEIEGLVSISIPFYNSEAFLSEAIESVLAQTYTRWELLLVDDGSADQSTEIARDYASRFKEKIHYLEHTDHRNCGLTCSRNLGARHSHGFYLAFLDSDDVWLPQKLENQVALMDAHPEAGLVYGLSEYWYSCEASGEEPHENHVPSLAPGGKLYFPPILLTNCYPVGNYGSPCPSSFLLRRSTFDRIGGFEECFNPKTHQMYEDIAFLAKVYLSVPVFVSECLWDRYRCHRTSMSHLVEGTSREEYARRYYFRWLRHYLLQHGVTNSDIWKTIRRKAWAYWLPLPASVTRLLRRIDNRLSR